MTRIIQVLSTSSRLHGQPWDQRSPKRRDLWADRGNKKWTRTWDSKRRLYGCQVSQGQVSHKTLGTLHLACHESLLLESHARSSISFMVGPLDGRVVRPWGTSSRHLVGAPPWGTRVPEGDCWHGGQGFSVILSHRHPQPSSPTIGGFPWNDLKVMTVKMTEGNPDMKAMPLNPICWKRGHVFPPWQLIISPII